MEDQVLDIAEELVPTPIYISQRTRLILLAAIVLAVIWLFMEAPSVLRLLLIGSTVALILSFPVRLLERWLPRGLAILIVVSSTVLAAIIGLILIIPFAINEITEFAEQLPEIGVTLEESARDVLMRFYQRGWIDQHPDQIIEDAQGNLLERSQVIAETLLNNALEALTRSFSIAVTSFGVIFIATYLLIDIPRFKEKFVLSFSPAYRPDADQLWSTVGESLSRYLAGLMISILIQGAMATIGLTLLDVPYALVLGVWMSVTAILPFVGAFLGAIPAVLIALTISWQMAVVVIGLFILINQVESNFITPRIQGTAVRVHPLLIFISVIGGSQIAGPLGAILAVPTLAVIRVLAEFLWVRLQVPQEQAMDTVLVALGGDDDDTPGANDDDGEMTVRAQGDSRVNITADDDIDIDIHARDHASVTTTNRNDAARAPNGIPRQHDTPPLSGFRPRPTVKRRRVSRKHTARYRTTA
jgi:predicted PurR-regulated permease PerM